MSFDGASLEQLIPDVLNVIISKLEYREYYRLACTNKNMSVICKNRELIRQRLAKEFPEMVTTDENKFYQEYSQLVNHQKRQKIINEILELMWEYSDYPEDEMCQLNKDLESFSSKLKIENGRLICNDSITNELIMHITDQTPNFDLLDDDDGIIYCHKVNNIFYHYCFNYRYLRYNLRDHPYHKYEYAWEKIGK